MTRNRPAFSLMELLVVIAIIMVLLGLLLAGIFGAFGKGKDVANKIDIGALDSAMASFKEKYKFYPPSKIRLCSKQWTYGNVANPQSNATLDADSKNILMRMFSRLDQGPWGDGSVDTPVGMQWREGAMDDDVVLTGDRCLVFFLGGIQRTTPSGRTCLGFGTDPRNPASFLPGQGEHKFMEFATARLIDGGGGFHSYLDAFGMPFAYFSANNKSNGYSKYAATLGSDCVGIWPYANSWTAPNVGVYENPDTFQIISAGKDKTFGPGCPSGTIWTPKNTLSAANGPGKDDQSNFHPLRLGISQ